MARPREFDIDEALHEAGERFWAKGYQATSIQDIAAATGVKPGSLYKTFGDKKSLFLKCVDHYMSGLSYKQLLEENYQKPLRECFESLARGAPPGWDTLSMGMSGDYPEAIRAGATMVRVGTAVFGERS